MTGGWPRELLPNLSYTKARMFRRCPEQFRRRYLLGEKARPGWALIAGEADHAAIAHDLTARLDGGPGVASDEVLDLCAQTFDERMDSWGGPGELDWGRLARDAHSPGDLKQLAVKQRETVIRGVGLYHSQACPKIVPVGVEVEYERSYPELPVPVIGFVDVETERGAIERKTTAQKKSAMPGDWRLQGLIYTAALNKDMRWDQTIRTKTPQVVEASFEMKASKANADLARRLLVSTVGQIQDCLARYGIDRPWPDALDHEWACKLCGWGPFQGNDTCTWWKR